MRCFARHVRSSRPKSATFEQRNTQNSNGTHTVKKVLVDSTAMNASQSRIIRVLLLRWLELWLALLSTSSSQINLNIIGHGIRCPAIGRSSDQ